MKEQELINSLKNGSEIAYQNIIDAYQLQVFNTCLNYVSNLQDAEDISQEVFIEVFKSIGNFRAESALSTWIYRITTTKSLELLRYQNRKKRAGSYQYTINIEDACVKKIMDKTNQPEKQLENKERNKVLFQQIDKLSNNQKKAFLLHKVEGRSHKEISAIMNTSISAIEALLHRAKKRLQVLLEPYYKMQLI